MSYVLPPAGHQNTLYLFDLSCWMFRYWATMKGRAAHGFLDFVGRVLSDRMPSHVAICADLPFPTFRHELSTSYKATREEKDPTLVERLRWAREMCLDIHGIQTVAVQGFEADDVLATLTSRATAAGMNVVMLALDKDMMQLVDGERVFMWDGKRSVVGPDQVVEKFGVPPTQLRDYLALVGDTVDGVPGVRGLGPKAAAELLDAYPDLDTMLKAALDVRAEGLFRRRPRYRSMLRDQAEEAKLYQKLVTLVEDVPIKRTLEDFRYQG